MDFVEKYRPRTLSEVRGNHKAVEELRKWALDWPSEKTTALLYGKPGTGKTSAALALANDMGWQLLELNASDKRTQGAVNAAVGAASRNASLQSARKLILLDEIDNLHGSADRGGAKAVTELVKKTREPVILTANELHGVSSTLRSYCKLIAFFAVREESAQKALVDIWHNERREVSRAQEAVVDLLARLEQPVEAAQDAAELEQLHADLEVLKQTGFDLEWRTVSDDLQAVVDLLARLEQPVEAAPDAELERLDADVAVLVHSLHDLEALRETLSDVGQSLNLVDMVSIQQIVKNARGDLRSAINDFQAYVGGAEVETASRDRVQSPFDLLRSIFGNKDPMASLTVSYSLDQTPEDLIHWVDENLPRSLKGAALAHAFQVLRRADTCLGRTRKRQNYGLWRYAAELMTSGVNVVSNQSSSQRNLNAKYSPPTHWMRLGQTRAKRAVRDAVATKIGATTHISINKARQDAIPLYKEIAERDPAGIMTALHLNADELAYLMNVKKDSQVVKSAFKEAEQLNKTETLVRQTAPEHPMQAGSGGTRSRSETRLQNGSGNQCRGPRQDTSKPAAQREQRSLKEY
ncbi:MAG TPA: AAA family ATPase [Candidatus Bathyarchaeia archaeon]|nr:AAA family ATPase [Candidatus Bathyarchaeia archaeon]